MVGFFFFFQSLSQLRGHHQINYLLQFDLMSELSRRIAKSFQELFNNIFKLYVFLFNMAFITMIKHMIIFQ